MKTEYEYNDCGVCTNPTITFSCKVGVWNAQAKIAQSPNGKWDYGYNVSYSTGGASCPVMLQEGDKGLSEEEAREQALLSIERFVGSMPETNKEDQKRMLEIIRDELSPKLF